MSDLTALGFDAQPAWANDRGQRLAWLVGIVVVGACLALLPLVQAVAVLGCLLGASLAMSRPGWAFAIVFLAIPLEFFVLDLGFVGLSAIQLLMLFVVTLMVAEMLAVGRLRIPMTPLDVPIFAWLSVGFLGAIGSVDPAAAIKKAGMALVLAALFYLVVAKVRRLETVSIMMSSLVAGCAALGLYGIWVSYRYLAEGIVTGGAMIAGSEGLAVPRASSTVSGPNLLAALMLIAIPIAIVLAITQRGWKRSLAVAANVVLFVALGFTFTRGAWMGAAVALPILAFERKPRRILIIVALALLLLAPSSVTDRVTSSTNTGRAEISHRFDYYQAALLIAETRPLFGVGQGNFRYAFSALDIPETAQRTAIHAHNIALVLLSETGLFGLLCFGAFLAGVLVLLLRKRRTDPSEERRIWRLAIAASIIGCLTQQLTDSLVPEPTVNAVLWVFAGLAVLFSAGMIDDGASAPFGSE